MSPLIPSSQKLTTFFAHRFIAFYCFSLKKFSFRVSPHWRVSTGAVRPRPLVTPLLSLPCTSITIASQSVSTVKCHDVPSFLASTQDNSSNRTMCRLARSASTHAHWHAHLFNPAGCLTPRAVPQDSINQFLHRKHKDDIQPVNPQL